MPSVVRDDASGDGADIAIICASPASTMPALHGFEVMPTDDVERPGRVWGPSSRP
jgi:hypothetical protein